MNYALIVDDDRRMAQTLADMVSLLGGRSQIAGTAEATLQALHDEVPDLVLLDLNLPQMNGLEILDYIQREMAGKKPEVVFVSAEDSPEVIERALRAGAHDYLLKPVEVDHLEMILSRLPNAGA